MSESIIIYPNPNSGEFTIQNIVSEKQTEIFLYDYSGSLIFRSEMIGDSLKVNENLKPGLYIIKAIANGYVQSTKILVQ